MKKLVAYSSVSHLGFVVLGIFSFTQQGLDGAVYQMLNHGISTGALFLLVGFLYERRHSLEISAYGGVSTPAPNLAVVFLITTLASIGLPTLNNFIGEYLVLQGASQANFGWAVFASLRRDLLRLLHAVALPASLLRPSLGRRPPPHGRSGPARMGGDSSSAGLNGLDGRLHTNLHATHQRAKCADLRASQPDQTSLKAIPCGGGQCSITMPTNAEYLRILPELILIVVGTLIMFLEAILKDDQKGIYGPLSIAGLIAAVVAAIAGAGDPGPAFHAMLQVDGFANFFRILVICVGILAIFSSMDYLKRENSPGGEFYALILFSVVGQCFMGDANELIMIFLGLEISSIASYILAGYLRDDARNNESALKYFLLGSFATAFLLYGVAWIYGATASTNLSAIREALAVVQFSGHRTWRVWLPR